MIPVLSVSFASQPLITKTYRHQVNLKTATADELQTLPGIGPKLSEQILEYRNESPFTENTDILKVKGIGIKRYTAIKHQLAP
jgi:competence protein ComEA